MHFVGLYCTVVLQCTVQKNIKVLNGVTWTGVDWTGLDWTGLVCLGKGVEQEGFCENFNHLKPTGYVMNHQFNIQQLYVLPTLYLCVLYLSENKQRLVSLTA